MDEATAHLFGLDIRGVTVNLKVDGDRTAAEIRSDFSAFLTSTHNRPDIAVTVARSRTDRARIPARTPHIRTTKDGEVYQSHGVRYIDSFGKALVRWRFATEEVEIYSADAGLLREKCYLVVMSRVGDLLDRRGLHRVHAMGVEYRDHGVLCVMAMGGGKTTLTLGLMRKPGFRLLSDEAPLISRSGQLLAMPIRLGVRRDTTLDIPDRFLSRFTRSRYPTKTLIDARYFGDRIADSAAPGILLVGVRDGAREPALIPISTFTALRALWDACVLARGIPQLLEYVLRAEIGPLLTQGRVLLSRMRACIALAARSRCYRLELSDDPDKNADFVAAAVAGDAEFIEERARDVA